MVKSVLAATALCLGLAANAEAGCLSGAVVGHLAGHHALAGAAAGCAIGHHHAVKAKKAHQAPTSDPSQNSSK